MASGPVGVIAAVTGLAKGSSPTWALIGGGAVSLLWLALLLLPLLVRLFP